MFDPETIPTRLIPVSVIAISVAHSAWMPASADADAEREALAHITQELEALSPLIRRAESESNPDARIRFRYDWLRQDLERVRLGIQEHIDAPRTEPRTFPPLRGDYRR